MTPEQINSVMAMEANVEKTRNQTVAQAYEALRTQALTEQTRKATELAGELTPYQQQQMDQWGASHVNVGGMSVPANDVFKELMSRRGERTVTVGDQSFTVSNKQAMDVLLNNLDKQPVTIDGQEFELPSKDAATLAMREKLSTVTKAFDWWRNPTTGDVQPVRKDEAPPKGYTNRVPSKEIQVSDIGERKFGFAQAKATRDAFQVATKKENKKRPAVKDDISFYNRFSEGTTGLIWLEEEGAVWGTNIKGATEVPLPKDNKGKQITMVDIRRVAEANHISPEEVLKQVYISMQKK